MLSDEEIRAVAELGRRVERHYHAPQEIEWAFDGDGALWLLQARRVTERLLREAARAGSR